MARCKTNDPAELVLLGKMEKAVMMHERWYRRLKRAFNRADKAKRTIDRLVRQLAKLRQEREV